MSTETAPVLVVARPEDLLAHVGTAIGPSSWYRVEQTAVDDFARATNDHQWIHVDPVRAAQGPFGSTIAHGYMSVALIAPLFTEIVQVHDQSMVVNYGIERVRFPAPVVLPARVRLTGIITAAELRGSAVQLGTDVRLEVEGGDKPACAAHVIYRYLP